MSDPVEDQLRTMLATWERELKTIDDQHDQNMLRIDRFEFWARVAIVVVGLFSGAFDVLWLLTR